MMARGDEASIIARSRQSEHAVWVVTVMFTLVCLVLQVPSATALTPVQGYNHVLAPTSKSSSLSNYPLIKDEAFLSKLEAIQSQSQTQSHAIITPMLQQCLDAERVTTQGQPAISTWVTGLGFRYQGRNFVENQFHANNAHLAAQILQARGTSTTNFVLAEVGVITTAHNRYALPDVLPTDCFRSGQGNVPNVGRDCRGWDIMFQNTNAYNSYLTNVLGIQNPQGQSHYHSEQALLASLYQDSQQCEQAGLQAAGCRLGQALTAAGMNNPTICTISAFTLDIISIPNSVCAGCERALHRGNFLSGYTQALNVFCGPNLINQRHLVFTSSLNLYTAAFGHISCLGLNHVNHIPTLTNDGIEHAQINGIRTSTGVILHKVPSGHVLTGNGQTLQARCVAASQPQC